MGILNGMARGILLFVGYTELHLEVETSLALQLGKCGMLVLGGNMHMDRFLYVSVFNRHGLRRHYNNTFSDERGTPPYGVIHYL